MNPTLEITVALPCTNGCLFCPQKIINKKYEGNSTLSYDAFKTMLDKIPKNVRIDFSGMCEPFQNKEASRMMRLAYESEYKIVLYTTLNGFNKNDVEELKKVCFDLIMVHIPDGFYYKGDYEKFLTELGMFRGLGCEPQYMTMGDIPKELSHIKNIQKPQMLSRGSNNHIYVTPKTGSIRCCIAGHDFDHNVMLPNGEVYLCCMDYSLKHNIGNILTEPYDFLMARLDAIKELANSKDGDLLCRKCEWGEIC